MALAVPSMLTVVPLGTRNMERKAEAKRQPLSIDSKANLRDYMVHTEEVGRTIWVIWTTKEMMTSYTNTI